MSEELLDVITEEDITVESKARSEVHRLGLWHRGAHVFLFNQDGKLLIQKRSADRVHSPSLLDCAVSEHVKAGESYFEAAVRGLKEEMGVENIELKEIVKFRMNYGPNDNEISVLFEGNVDSSKIQFDPDEISEVMYYDIHDLRAEIKNHPEKFCGWFKEIVKCYFNEPANMVVLNVK
jgi:isopentenyl-diphosphate delta-isomerase